MEPAEATRVVRGARRFFLEKGFLFKRTLDGMPQRCVDKGETEEVLQKMHGTEHQGWSFISSWFILDIFGPLWKETPSGMSKDAKHVRSLGLWFTPPPWSCIQSAPHTLFTHGPWTWSNRSLQPRGRTNGFWQPQKFAPNGSKRRL